MSTFHAGNTQHLVELDRLRADYERLWRRVSLALTEAHERTERYLDGADAAAETREAVAYFERAFEAALEEESA